MSFSYSRRYTNADFYNVPEDAASLTRKRSGTYRAYYDATGRLMHAYSYNTCIFTRLPNGRAVFNRTHYSNTTIRHQYNLIYDKSLALPTIWGMDEGDDRTACDVIDAPVGVTASGLVSLVTQYMSYPEAYNAR